VDLTSISRSISRMPFEEAVQKVLAIRQQRRKSLELRISESRKAREPAKLDLKKELLSLTDEELKAVLSGKIKLGRF
jgi:hypothetical protein